MLILPAQCFSAEWVHIAILLVIIRWCSNCSYCSRALPLVFLYRNYSPDRWAPLYSQDTLIFNRQYTRILMHPSTRTMTTGESFLRSSMHQTVELLSHLDIHLGDAVWLAFLAGRRRLGEAVRLNLWGSDTRSVLSRYAVQLLALILSLMLSRWDVWEMF